MVSDVNELLRVARELNKESDALRSGSSSREDVRRVAKIEKLAHNVKWKMQLVVDVDRGQ
jgi:hypothetical protein